MITVRASSLPKWADCPRRSAANIFNKELRELGYDFRSHGKFVSGILGTAVHAGASHTLKNKMVEKDTPLNEAIEISIETYKKKSVDGIDYDDITNTRNTAEKQITNISTVFHTQIAPSLHPLAVEQEMKAKLSDTMIVSGHADDIEEDSVHDTKTGASGQTYQAQGGCYSLSAKANQIAVPKEFVVDHIPRTSLRKPQPDAVQYRYDIGLCEQEAKSVLNEIKRTWMLFDEHHDPAVFMANLSSMLCSPKYCAAFGTDWCPLSKTLR